MFSTFRKTSDCAWKQTVILVNRQWRQCHTIHMIIKTMPFKIASSKGRLVTHDVGLALLAVSKYFQFPFFWSRFFYQFNSMVENYSLNWLQYMTYKYIKKSYVDISHPQEMHITRILTCSLACFCCSLLLRSSSSTLLTTMYRSF